MIGVHPKPATSAGIHSLKDTMPDIADDVPDTNMTYSEVLDCLNDCGCLSEWEVEFLDDMLKKRESSYTYLSDKQAAMIEKIFDKKCS